MTQHLRTTRMPTGTYIQKQVTSSFTMPQYYIPGGKATITTEGLLYNWPAAINLGTGAGQTPDPLTSNYGGAHGYQVSIQGICPTGWHLPNDQEFTDLENGVTSPHGNLDYDSDQMRGTTPGRILKSATPVDNQVSNGTSPTNVLGGFDALLVGSVGHDVNINRYGILCSMWSASSSYSNGSSAAWSRQFMQDENGSSRDNFAARQNLFSIRCKRNDQ